MGSVLPADQFEAQYCSLGKVKRWHTIGEFGVHDPIEPCSDERRRGPQCDVKGKSASRTTVDNDVPLPIEPTQCRGHVRADVSKGRTR
jgi:hypothetical protein